MTFWGCFLLWSQGLSAQSEGLIRGRVVDLKTKQPIPYAEAMLFAAADSLFLHPLDSFTTGLSAEFQFEVPPGEGFKVFARAPEYGNGDWAKSRDRIWMAGDSGAVSLVLPKMCGWYCGPMVYEGALWKGSFGFRPGKAELNPVSRGSWLDYREWVLGEAWLLVTLTPSEMRSHPAGLKEKRFAAARKKMTELGYPYPKIKFVEASEPIYNPNFLPERVYGGERNARVDVFWKPE